MVEVSSHFLRFVANPSFALRRTKCRGVWEPTVRMTITNDHEACDGRESSPTLRAGLCPLARRVTDSEKMNIKLACTARRKIATSSLSNRVRARARWVLILEN